jgi:RND family efflux transporter MFP subunit
MSEKKLKSWVIVPAVIVALGIGIAGGLLIGTRPPGPDETAEGQAAAGQQLYSCGMHPDIIRDEPGNCPICGMKLTPITGVSTEAAKPQGERKVKYWRAPMDPTYISDKPGKSPMGMDLVPVYEDEIAEGAISIDPVTVQNMGLRTALVKKGKLVRTIRTVGHIDYDETKLHIINTKITGWIEKLHVNTTGEVVEKGQPLLEIYSPELVSTQEEYLSALRSYSELKESRYEEARQGALELVNSAKKRLEYWDIDEAQIRSLEKKGEIKKTLTLYSPAAGVVLHKNAVEGAHVKAGSDLFRIADLSTVWVLAQVYESDLPFIELGQHSEINLPYMPGESFQGEVTYIYPYLDKKTRDVQLRLQFPNPGYKLKPEMYANVVIKSELPGERILIPEESVIHSGKREIVFVDMGQGKYAPREITTGASGKGNVVEVIKGLLSGEMIVASGQFMLDSESKTQEAIQKMIKAKMEAPAEAHEHPTAEMKEEEHLRQQEEPVSEVMEEEGHEHVPGEVENLNLTPDKKAHYADEVYTCPMDEHSHVLQVGPGRCPECEMFLVPITETGRAVWTCPMEEHHHILSNRPGECPECGMKLIKLRAREEGGGR